MNFGSRLSALDACTVSDAKDMLGLEPAISDIPRRSTDRTIAGQVITVKLGATRPENAPIVHLGTRAVERSGPGTIIVVEQLSGIDAGAWGGILSNAAKIKGCTGVIVEGACRDIDEARELDFTVYARRTTALTARGRVYEQETGGQITVGTATVNDGDWVIADDSGIVFIAQNDIERVLTAAERIVAKEKLMLAALREGKPAPEVMGANYEHMLDGGDQ